MKKIKEGRIRQIVRNVINETWTQKNTLLKDHMKNIHNMDEKTLLTLSNVYPSLYMDFLEAVNKEAYDEHYYDLCDYIDGNTDYNMSYFIQKHNLPIDKRFGYYVKNCVNRYPRRYFDDAKTYWSFKEIPDNITLNYKNPFMNKVLIHFSNNDGDAEDIFSNGFKYGAKLDHLAWTCGFKDNGDYGFAYDFNDLYDNIGNYVRYGTEGIVFIASGVRIKHFGDTKNIGTEPPYECIFDINSVKEFICRFVLSHGHCKIYDSNNRLVLKKDNWNLEKMMRWISNNMIIY